MSQQTDQQTDSSELQTTVEPFTLRKWTRGLNPPSKVIVLSEGGGERAGSEPGVPRSQPS